MQRPRPVLTASSVHGLVLAAGLVLAFLGYNQTADNLSAMSTTIVSVVLGAVGLGSHLLAGAQAQKEVTPLASPRAADGTPLVPISSPVAAPLVTVAKHAADEPDGPLEVANVDIPADPEPAGDGTAAPETPVG